MSNYRAPRIIGRLIKLFFTLIILAINAILVWRVFFSAAIPDGIKTLTPNEQLSAAYAQYGDELTLRYQDLATITRAEQNYGYFSVPQCVFIPQANQVQIVFRYNNSTLEHLREDYALEQLPSREETLFDVTLVRTTDLTPENKEDNIKDVTTLAKERYMPTSVERDTTTLYTYYRFVFDGITVEELTDGIFVDVYYVGDIHYEQSAYGTLCIYDYLSEWLPYKPSSADKKALAGEL